MNTITNKSAATLDSSEPSDAIFDDSPTGHVATLLGATIPRKAAARYLGRSYQTLANWATNGGRGLRYFVINGRAMYRMDDLVALANSDVPGYANVSGEVAQ